MRRDRAPSRWILDERAFAGRENLDPAHVSQYDEKEDSAAEAELELIRSLGLGSASTVVEFGAGTGQLAVRASPHCGRYVAVDISAPMLARLATKAEAARLENLELVEAGFVGYEHSGPPADFVYSRLALHHLPDFWKGIALARIRRLMRPRAVLRLWDVVYDFGPSEAEDGIAVWRESFPEVTAEGQWTRADVDEHVRDEHSTFTWLLEPLIERAGFEIEVAEHSGDGIWARYVARAV
ncbi:methyltransferase domain-containing protein [Thermoleophilia bacterium SCSIO 60948]|nr:methyltransferase domain-containing protein [Thermoleophilia bacterium SCSIO 60948]